MNSIKDVFEVFSNLKESGSKEQFRLAELVLVTFIKPLKTRTDQLTFTCSKSSTETRDKEVKYVRS